MFSGVEKECIGKEWVKHLRAIKKGNQKLEKNIRVNRVESKCQEDQIMVSSENAGEVTDKGKFFLLFAERVQAVIPSSTTSAGVACIEDIVVLKVN